MTLFDENAPERTFRVLIRALFGGRLWLVVVQPSDGFGAIGLRRTRTKALMTAQRWVGQRW